MGDVNRGEIAFLQAGDVVRLGHNADGASDYSLVKLSAQFTPDRTDSGTGAVTPGARGTFWTVFPSTEQAQDQLVIPFVADAPEGAETPFDVPRASSEVTGMNAQLRELGLKGLPFPVNEPGERIHGIADLIDVNKNYFTVVVFDVEDTQGRIRQHLIIFNAHSDTGIEGAVFAAAIKKSEYGGEPRLLIGQSYRPNLGSTVSEVPRGFYNPSAELAHVKGLTDTDIPAVQRAIEEFNSESGMVDPRLRLISLGGSMQDPTFEASIPSLYKISINDPNYGAPQIEPGEKYSVDLLTLEEAFRAIPRIQDAFTLTAMAKSLVRAEILRISPQGRRAQDNGERMVLGRPYRFQHGVYTTEVLRTNPEGMPIDDSLGTVAVNTGIARVLPEVYSGNASWDEIRSIGQQRGFPTPRLLYPSRALEAIANGELDIVTSAAIMRALHARNYLTLDFRNLQLL